MCVRLSSEVTAASPLNRAPVALRLPLARSVKDRKLPAAPPTALRAAGDPYVRRARRSGPVKELQATTKVNPQGVGGFAALTFVVPNLVRTRQAGK